MLWLDIPTSNDGLSWLSLLEDMAKHRGILLSVSHDGVSLGFLSLMMRPESYAAGTS